MRVYVILMAVVVAAGGLAGCFGSDDEPATPANTGNNGGLPGGNTGAGGLINILAPLKTKFTTTADAWVAPGSPIDVTATPPANAGGQVTYTWSIGALPGTVAGPTMALDTSNIDPGQKAELTFTAAGVYRAHCHPHPYMLHNVTVVDGYMGAETVHVQIIDGASQDEYRFVPQEILIGKGTTVVYHNNGTQMHTTTVAATEPPLKKLPLDKASGSITVTGEGWQRIVLTAKDSEGRIGSAEHHVYVKSLPAAYSQTFTYDFKVGGAPAEVEPAKTSAFKLDFPGTVFVNWTAKDAGQAAAPEDGNTALIELHLIESGTTQDTLTGDASASGSQSSKVNAESYTLRVIPKQGAGITATVLVTVIYDAIPPAPATASAGGDDGHGGHAGH